MYYSSKTLAGILVVFCITLFSVGTNYAIDSPSQSNKSHKPATKSKTRMSKPITGEWAGKHITLKITERGADVEYDCARGTIDKKIIPDKNDRFDVLGTYIEEHGGPVRESDAANSYAVRFIGRIRGKRMTLVVKHKDNNKVIGTFSLLHGQESLLVKCR